jgi:interleukin-1 receptor-associated kinase 1
MSMEGAQRVLVIQDASREVSSSAIKWALHGLSLKPGDMLTLLGVLHLVNTPCK